MLVRSSGSMRGIVSLIPKPAALTGETATRALRTQAPAFLRQSVGAKVDSSCLHLGPLASPQAAPFNSSQRRFFGVENFAKKISTKTYDKQTYMTPMVNHIWSKEEISDRLNKPQPLHTPKTLADKFMYHLVKTVCYRGFNFVTRFDKDDPTDRSCAYRLIILESIAGVPGMVAAVLRHFNSLRTLRRDHGWIHTLLEEAMNERMHLLVCMQMFDAGIMTRLACTLGQFGLTTFLVAVYMVHPRSLHRFVGYLEETAVLTYVDLVKLTRKPGTKLHKAWSEMPAPELAKAYWNMPEDAMWVDVLENLLADETHHRDVNHAFADMDQREANPFVERHMADLAKHRELLFKPNQIKKQ